MNPKERIAHLRSAAGQRQPSLQAIHVHGEVRGLLLSMTLRQSYRNMSSDTLETVYSFPLAWGATLLSMRVTLNGRTMQGQVIDSGDAEKRYEQAIEDSDLPVMLVAEGKQLYSARLGNLKPGDDAIIEITYAQLLAPENGRTRITVPTTIAPRFGRDPGLKGLIAHAIGAIDALAEYRLFLTLNLQGPLARARIACPSHSVSQQVSGQGTTITLSQKAMLDRDFILTIDAEDTEDTEDAEDADDVEDADAAVAGTIANTIANTIASNIASTIASPEPGNGNACMLLSSFVPPLPAASDAPLALKILVDCSGSMAGDGIQLARQAIAAALRQLRPEDQVSFTRFGSRAAHVIDRLVPADTTHLVQLAKALQAIEADLGGTELDQALRQVIALRDSAHELPETASILLITDGEVWDIEPIVATARQSGHQVFALGVGSAPAESLLRELAEVTGGAAELASPGEDVAIATQRLLTKMRSMRDVEITATLDGEPVSLPRCRFRAGAGETLHLWYPLPSRPAHAPDIVVTDLASGRAFPVPGTPIDWEAEGQVARLGAAKRLLDISDTDARREIALTYQLLTNETPYFLVHERHADDKAIGLPVLEQVGNMLAAGWGGTGSLRECATPTFDTPAFLRRQPDVTGGPSHRPPMFSRGNTPEPGLQVKMPPSPLYGLADSQHDAESSTSASTCTSLAELVAGAGDANNPLARMVNRLDITDSNQLMWSALVTQVDAARDMTWLRPLLDVLESLTGNREIGLLLLLHWVSQQTPACVTLQGRLATNVARHLDALPARVRAAAMQYLDGEARRGQIASLTI